MQDRRMLRFLPAVVWMAVIFTLSAQSGGELNTWLPSFQKLLPGLESFDPMHYAAYFVLGLTVAYGFGNAAFTWRGALLVVLVCVLYGGTDEWHQSYVPLRSPDWMDLRNDTIGAVAAVLVWQLLRLRAGRNRGKYYSNG